jgi:hypothetical protein
MSMMPAEESIDYSSNNYYGSIKALDEALALIQPDVQYDSSILLNDERNRYLPDYEEIVKVLVKQYLINEGYVSGRVDTFDVLYSKVALGQVDEIESTSETWIDIYYDDGRGLISAAQKWQRSEIVDKFLSYIDDVDKLFIELIPQSFDPMVRLHDFDALLDLAKKNGTLPKCLIPSENSNFFTECLKSADAFSAAVKAEKLIDIATEHRFSENILLKANENNESALFVAATHGCYAITDVVLKSIHNLFTNEEFNSYLSNDLSSHNSDGKTMLFEAIRKEQINSTIRILKEAKDAGMEVNDLIQFQCKDGKSPIEALIANPLDLHKWIKQSTMPQEIIADVVPANRLKLIIDPLMVSPSDKDKDSAVKLLAICYKTQPEKFTKLCLLVDENGSSILENIFYSPKLLSAIFRRQMASFEPQDVSKNLSDDQIQNLISHVAQYSDEDNILKACSLASKDEIFEGEHSAFRKSMDNEYLTGAIKLFDIYPYDNSELVAKLASHLDLYGTSKMVFQIANHYQIIDELISNIPTAMLSPKILDETIVDDADLLKEILEKFRIIKGSNDNLIDNNTDLFVAAIQTDDSDAIMALIQELKNVDNQVISNVLFTKFESLNPPTNIMLHSLVKEKYDVFNEMFHLALEKDLVNQSLGIDDGSDFNVLDYVVLYAPESLVREIFVEFAGKNLVKLETDILSHIDIINALGDLSDERRDLLHELCSSNIKTDEVVVGNLIRQDIAEPKIYSLMIGGEYGLGISGSITSPLIGDSPRPLDEKLIRSAIPSIEIDSNPGYKSNALEVAEKKMKDEEIGTSSSMESPGKINSQVFGAK